MHKLKQKQLMIRNSISVLAKLNKAKIALELECMNAICTEIKAGPYDETNHFLKIRFFSKQVQ